MKTIFALAATCLIPTVVLAAGPKDSPNAADRYDYNMRTSNRDGYTDGARSPQGKFDPYTQGANSSTSSSLTDSSAAPKKPSGKKHSSKKTGQDAASHTNK